MKLSPTIAHVRDFCLLFDRRVSGGIDWSALEDSAKLEMPAAFVVATGDDPEPNALQNGTRQEIADEFDIVVALRQGNERGQAAADELHDVRAALLRALVGWVPDEGYEPIEYTGCDLVSTDRLRVIYRFGFSAVWTLGSGDDPETWHEDMLNKLPRLKGVDIHVDAIDPMADPNLKKPGPDGRIEIELLVELKDDR
ncbi:hypothetical protein BPS26883_06148 [Burkholderia pseudomultivorans]|uniref:Uncharacterized protein n=1 Tax=Burkholderia pseudomultivorans TaxID=1207504 RepID=A0A6P2QV31_9BURK|nr:hypothetical protein [Burkholderia pseudomultivorans]VWC26314.1 hypothetical protein BPS26883_06148 [Burkholderia pseudomultivorans]